MIFRPGEMTREEFPCEIVRRLPGGFMAEVYLAKLQNTRHFMVVKGVPQNAPASFRESLKREAEMLKKIRLESIPEVYGYFEEKEKRYFIMSYHEGSNLEELLSKGTIPEKQIKEIELLTVGAVQAKLPMYNIQSMKILVPPTKIIEDFQRKMDILNEQIEANTVEVQKLFDLQSVLLAKLSD